MRWRQLFTPVQSMDTKELKEYIINHEEGEYTLLDVRQPSEYKKEHIPGARLIPLPDLPDQWRKIDPENPVMVYCSVGGRSRSAAQLLAGNGLKKIYNIKGGIKAWHNPTAIGPLTTESHLLKGDESLETIIAVAYELEDNLKKFYNAMADRSHDKDITDTFTRLADIEEQHKERLFQLHLSETRRPLDIDNFRTDISVNVMEGGYTVEEFIEQNRKTLQSPSNVIEMAMEIETQSLDLYSRYARNSTTGECRNILHGMAQEEKVHLVSLGNLLEMKA